MAPLPGDQPEVAGVAQAGAVADERLLGLVLGLDQDDRAVELAGAHQAAADGLLDVAPQAGADVAGDLDALLGLHARASGPRCGGCSRVLGEPWRAQAILPFAEGALDRFAAVIPRNRSARYAPDEQRRRRRWA